MGLEPGTHREGGVIMGCACNKSSKLLYSVTTRDGQLHKNLTRATANLMAAKRGGTPKVQAGRV